MIQLLNVQIQGFNLEKQTPLEALTFQKMNEWEKMKRYA